MRCRWGERQRPRWPRDAAAAAAAAQDGAVCSHPCGRRAFVGQLVNSELAQDGAVGECLRTAVS